MASPSLISQPQRLQELLPGLDTRFREHARLAALKRYHVLDTDPESNFDDLTELAANVCQMPMALVSLVDTDRQWFKSRLGLDVCSTDREVAFCTYAVESGSLFVIPDATADPRFRENPLVTGAPFIRSYAGAPLITPEGHVLGTLCVLDTVPRTLSSKTLSLLSALARQAMNQLEHRRQTYRLTVEIAGHELAEQKLAQQKQFDEAVLESVSAGVLACDADGRIVVRNAAQRRMTGVADGDPIVGDRVSGRLKMLLADGSELAPGKSPLRQAMAGGELVEVPMRIGQLDGPLSDVLVTARQIRDPAGALLGAVAAFTDITSEREVQSRLRASAAFHDAVLAASPDLIFVVDPRTGRTEWSSRKVTETLGYTEEQVFDLGENIIEALVHPDDVEAVRAANLAVRELADLEVLQMRYRARHADGDYRWLSRRITPFARDEAGTVVQILGVARDISDIVQIEERLSAAALHDPLTGLPNRTLLRDRLAGALARSARNGLETAVLFCDLDGFKSVNDTGGHAAGDQVLTECAARLRATLRGADTVARVGGDEFVIVIEPGIRRHEVDAGGPVDVRADAIEIVGRLQREISAPISVQGSIYTVTSSIGIALATPGSEPDDVLREADIAMYRAKSQGKDRYEIFAPTGSASPP